MTAPIKKKNFQKVITKFQQVSLRKIKDKSEQIDFFSV